jgi:hypothetical protein
MRDWSAFAMLFSSEEMQEMESRHSTFTRALVVAVLCPFLLAGCTRTYVYGSGQMLKISEGRLHVREFQRSHAPPDSFEVERIGVRHLSDPGLLRAPTNDELDDLLSGRALDAHIIEFDVDVGLSHWRDYGLGGAGVGVSLGLLSSLSRETNSIFFGDSQAGVLILSVMLASVGFMAGLIGGSLAAPDVVDMRYAQEFEPQ